MCLGSATEGGASNLGEGVRLGGGVGGGGEGSPGGTEGMLSLSGSE